MGLTCAEDSDWDEEGNVVCQSEEDLQQLSPHKQRLVLLQNLLVKEGLEA